MVIVRFVFVFALLVGVGSAFGGMPRSARAVAVAGEAYGLAAGAPPAVVGGSPAVSLPATGGSLSDTTPGAGLGVGSGAGNADGLNATAVGDANAGTVTSTAAVDVVELFGGVIRGTDLRVTASASVNGRASSGAQMTATSLTVGGLVFTEARPNTRVELPGLGYAILNEQRVGGDGSSASASINAIHLWVTVPSILGVPAGTEIIVAHASAGSPDVNATRLVPSGALPTATPVPWAPISTLRPIDISIGDNGNLNDNASLEFDNENGNDNGGTGVVATAISTARATTTTTTGTTTPIVVTVVVVVATPTNTPVPTSSPTP
jgi:hypothetical protein